MREIKFRGKTYQGKWIYGYCYKVQSFFDLKFNWFIRGNHQNDEMIIPETLSQYTGLKDKNGVEIYEGDIVQWADIKMEIFWGEDIGCGYGFCWRPYGEEQFYHESMTGFVDEYEVIGNIYENKLKEEGK